MPEKTDHAARACAGGFCLNILLLLPRPREINHVTYTYFLLLYVLRKDTLTVNRKKISHGVD
jgi:hypothetical protein